MNVLTEPLTQEQLDEFEGGVLEVVVPIDLNELVTYNPEAVLDILVNRVTLHPYNIYDVEYNIVGHDKNTVFMKVIATVDELV